MNEPLTIQEAPASYQVIMDSLPVRVGYKQTEVGVIPEDWEVTKLGEIGECLIGLTYKPSNIKTDGTLVLRSSNVQNGSLAFDDNVYVDADISDRIRVRDGDILVCVRNGSRSLIGKCALLDERVVGQTFGAFMSVFRTDSSAFIFQQFQSALIKRQISENIGATINQITNRNLNSFKVPYPTSVQEREIIATALSDVDAQLAAQDKLIAKKRDIKQATMQQLLTGQTRLPGFSGEWEVKRLGDLLEYEQPTKYLVKDSEYSDDNDMPVLTAGKTFILGYTNEVHGVFNNLPAIIFDDFTTANKYVTFPFKAKSSAMKILKQRDVTVNLRLVYEMMQLIKFQLGDHKRYWISEYQKLEMKVPDADEQAAIAAVLSDMDAELVALEQQRDKTRALKQAMMQELLTGRIRLV
jgi:type I restriction enzyme S subunit